MWFVDEGSRALMWQLLNTRHFHSAKFCVWGNNLCLFLQSVIHYLFNALRDIVLVFVFLRAHEILSHICNTFMRMNPACLQMRPKKLVIASLMAGLGLQWVRFCKSMASDVSSFKDTVTSCLNDLRADELVTLLSDPENEKTVGLSKLCLCCMQRSDNNF